MLNDLPRQIFVPYDGLDDFVEVDGFETVRVKNPGKGPKRVVGKENDLKTAGEHGAMEKIVIKDSLQIAALFLLFTYQNGFEQFVVKCHAHFESHPGKRVVRARVALGRRRVAVAKRVTQLFDQVRHLFRGIFVSESPEKFQQLGSRLRPAFVQHMIEPGHEVGGCGNWGHRHLLLGLQEVPSAQRRGGNQVSAVKVGDGKVSSGGGGHLLSEIGAGPAWNGKLGRGANVLVGVLTEEDPLVVFSDAEDVGFVILADVLGVGFKMGGLQDS